MVWPKVESKEAGRSGAAIIQLLPNSSASRCNIPSFISFNVAFTSMNTRPEFPAYEIKTSG
jgi:hypothetical protein